MAAIPKYWGPGSVMGSTRVLKYPDPLPDFNGKTCIVTGANSGCGYETSVWFAKRGAKVILACRSPGKANEALQKLIEAVPEAKDRVEFWQLDLSQLKSVRAFAVKWAERAKTVDDQGKLDFLINNAGSIWLEKQTTEDGFEISYQTNHLAPFLLTLLLLPYLKLASAPYARVINVSSGAAYGKTIDTEKMNANDMPDAWSFPFNITRGFEVYGRSKLMQILFTVELQRRLSLQPSLAHIIVHAVHPGAVASGFTSQSHLNASAIVQNFVSAVMNIIARTPAQGAMCQLWAAASHEAGVEGQGGKMWFDCISMELPKQANDVEACKKVWEKNLVDAGVDRMTLGGQLVNFEVYLKGV